MSDEQPDLDALADRLEAPTGADAGDVPVFRSVTGGSWRSRVRIVGVTVVAFALPAGWLASTGRLLTALVFLGLALLLGALTTVVLARTTVVVDEERVAVEGFRLRSDEGLPWRRLLEVGLVELPSGQLALVLRPEGGRWDDPGPLSPRVVPLPLRGADLESLRDALEHGCRRHGVVFTEDGSALDTAPPGSPLRGDR